MEFKDLMWNSWQNGVSSSELFDNGFEMSIVAGPGKYSSPKDEGDSPDDFSSFEVAIFNPQGDWVTKEFFPGHNDDVMGWQSREDINNLIKKISK
tara:strand:- start:4870 stop:5154 length:285 start_codon:yes stop_codon:yes gene_type:complete